LLRRVSCFASFLEPLSIIAENEHLVPVARFDTIEQAKHGSIFTDRSGIASSNNNVIEYAVGRVGSAHIFFGTDTCSCAFQRGRIQFAGISDQDKENILRNNALCMFPGKFCF
jgi:predicted TIM-barrel fold metal-dependent hydrolase